MNKILKPELKWIEGRCYRVNDTNTNVSALQEHDLYENEINYQDNEDEEDENDSFEIFMLDDNRYCTNFHIASHYHGCIIGRKAGMKNRIERDTKTQIKIPRMGENKDIIIHGASAANVKAARRRINIIVMAARKKFKPTHFISIPMNFPEIMTSYRNFKELVLKECSGSSGLEESLFISPEKLHITLGVTCLMDNEERLHASKLMAEARNTIILPLIQDYLPFKIRLKGLSYMNDDPKKIHVLYGCVEEVTAPPGLLQRVVDTVVDHFRKQGFMWKEYDRDNVKLHVTLLNSKYRGRKCETVADELLSSSKKQRIPFDGSDILRKFADYDFGVMEMSEMHLSQRKSMGPDGFYQPTCVISCIKVGE